MKYFPLFVAGNRLKVLLVGGGTIAAAKLETLAAAGARMTVVAPQFGDGVLALAERYPCTLLRQEYEPELLGDHNVIVAATDDSALGKRIADDARASGIWANIVDAPALCDFIFPAITRHGPLQIAISTGGASPVMARLLKQDIEQILPEEIEALLTFMGNRTAEVREKLPDVQRRRLFWERVIRGPICRLLGRREEEAADQWFTQALRHTCEGQSLQSLHVLGVSSFDPDNLTVRMVRVIGQADLILYGGGRAMLPILDRYARRDADKYAVVHEVDPVHMMEGLLGRGGAIVYLVCQKDETFLHIRDRMEELAISRAFPFVALQAAM